MKKYQKLGLILAIGMSFTGAANSAVLYDNLNGPLGGSLGLPGTTNSIANQFSTGSFCPNNCTLDSITLNLNSSSGSSAGYTLSVFTDNNTALGTLLGTLLTPAFVTNPNTNYTFSKNGTITLANNTKYWVQLKGSAGSAILEWNYSSGNGNNIDPQGRLFPDLPPKMKVEATPVAGAPVPVPAPFYLMGSALLGFVATWKRKKLA